MLRAYLDESYSQTHFYVAAAVGPVVAWDNLAPVLAEIRGQAAQAYGLPPDIEFHAHELLGGNKNWKALRGRHREAHDIVRRILEAAAEAGISYIVRGVDREALINRYGEAARHPHSVCLEHVMQQLQKHAELKNQPPNSLQLIADEVDLKEELQASFQGYQESGTSSWFEDNKLSHLQAPILFQDSRTADGLQVVDLVVYLYRRNELIPERHPVAIEAMQEHMKLLQSRLIKSSSTWIPQEKNPSREGF